MDYPQRTRLKILGHSRVVDARENAAIADQLSPSPELRGKVERLFLIKVVGFDWNCPQYITPRFTAAEIAEASHPLHARIAKNSSPNSSRPGRLRGESSARQVRAMHDPFHWSGSQPPARSVRSQDMRLPRIDGHGLRDPKERNPMKTQMQKTIRWAKPATAWSTSERRWSILEEQWPQRGQDGGGARDPGAALVPVGEGVPAGGPAGPPARSLKIDVTVLQAEIRRLTEERTHLKLLEQREILKKSLGIFSEPPPRGMPKSSK